MYEPYFSLIHTNDNHSKKNSRQLATMERGILPGNIVCYQLLFRGIIQLWLFLVKKKNSYLLEIKTEIFIALK